MASDTNGILRWLAEFEGRLGRYLAPMASRAFTAHQITVLSGAISVVGALVMSMGGYWEMVGGAALFYFGRWLDYLDGPVARHVGRTSEFGQTLDTIGTALSLVVLFVGIGLLYGGPFYWLGIAAAALALVNRILNRVRKRLMPDHALPLKQQCHRHPALMIAYDNFGCPPFWLMVPFAAADLFPVWFLGAVIGHAAWCGFFLIEIKQLVAKRA